MRRHNKNKDGPSLRFVLVAALIATLSFPFFAEYGYFLSSLFFPVTTCQAEQTRLRETSLNSNLDKKITPWEKLNWINERSSEQGVIATEDRIMSLVEDLATSSSSAVRKNFLRKELRNGVIKKIAFNNEKLNEMVANLFIIGAIDSIENGNYIQAESFLNASKGFFTGLKSQKVVSRNLSLLTSKLQNKTDIGILGATQSGFWSLMLTVFLVFTLLVFALFILLPAFRRSEKLKKVEPFSRGDSIYSDQELQEVREEEYDDFEYDYTPIPVNEELLKRGCELSLITEETGLSRVDAGSLYEYLKVDDINSSVDDVLLNPDAVVGDLINFDFAVGPNRNSD